MLLSLYILLFYYVYIYIYTYFVTIHLLLLYETYIYYYLPIYHYYMLLPISARARRPRAASDDCPICRNVLFVDEVIDLTVASSQIFDW